jgi:hypothetical protein
VPLLISAEKRLDHTWLNLTLESYEEEDESSVYFAEQKALRGVNPASFLEPLPRSWSRLSTFGRKVPWFPEKWWKIDF